MFNRELQPNKKKCGRVSEKCRPTVNFDDDDDNTFDDNTFDENAFDDNNFDNTFEEYSQ